MQQFRHMSRSNDRKLNIVTGKGSPKKNINLGILVASKPLKLRTQHNLLYQSPYNKVEQPVLDAKMRMQRKSIELELEKITSLLHNEQFMRHTSSSPTFEDNWDDLVIIPRQ